MEAVASAQGETDMMNTGVNQGSARIYQFPTEFAAPPASLGDCSDSWYHAAAIEDEKNGRDH
jgi:hypothetical protein